MPAPHMDLGCLGLHASAPKPPATLWEGVLPRLATLHLRVHTRTGPHVRAEGQGSWRTAQAARASAGGCVHVLRPTQASPAQSQPGAATRTPQGRHQPTAVRAQAPGAQHPQSTPLKRSTPISASHLSTELQGLSNRKLVTVWSTTLATRAPDHTLLRARSGRGPALSVRGHGSSRPPVAEAQLARQRRAPAPAVHTAAAGLAWPVARRAYGPAPAA